MKWGKVVAGAALLYSAVGVWLVWAYYKTKREYNEWEIDWTLLENVHSRRACKGEPCVVHNPSNHHMRRMRQIWRNDRGIAERICDHGIGHPDPDTPATVNTMHGCDGCCYVPIGATG